MRRSIRAMLAFASLSIAFTAQAQSWHKMPNVPNLGAYNPLLLTDGSVMIQDADNDQWWKLSPDKTGSYLNGKWTQLTSTPGYGPLYYASAVLPDGRVFTMGGEYNMGSGTIWQNLGYIYDPALNIWTFLPAPSGWNNIGDMGSITLPSGKVMIMDPFSSQGALFDPSTGTFTAPYGGGKFDGSDEEGLTLLPNGKVLTVDTSSPHSEIFDPATLQWSSAGSTPASLVGLGSEIGPQVLRPDGTVICFGGGSHNCVYHTSTGTWTQAPDFPTINSAALCCADAPACLLTNGNVLVMTGPPNFGSGAVFFEWDGTNLKQVPGTPNSPGNPSFVGSMLMLPSGEVMVTDFSNDIELYTTTGSPKASWAPTITGVPVVVSAGGSYVISGTQFNGLSGSSAYGDDEQNFTNYPIIRITNKGTGHVFYCKEYNPSTMAIWTGSKIVTTNFKVPNNIETGASTIEVVTNGIPSTPVSISVGPPIKAANVSVYAGSYIRGALSSIWLSDGDTYEVRSSLSSAGQLAAVEADFTLPNTGTSVSSLTVFCTAAAQTGVTGQLYLYDWTTNTYVYLPNADPLTSKQISFNAVGTGTISRFIGPSNQVKAIIRAVAPTRTTSVPFTLSVDQIYVG